ncbi:MAG: serine hydrolase domain-containing protein, partial [Bacteroidota bacterium]
MLSIRFLGSIICLLLCFNTSVGQLNPNKVLLNKIDSLVSTWDNPKNPGGAIAIYKENELLFEKYFGLEDMAQKVKISKNTPFHLASISKQFTGMCIALLEEQGKIKLNDEICPFFPALKLCKGIRIKHLLSHSSGIREASVIAILSGYVNFKGELPVKRNNNVFLTKVLEKERDVNFVCGAESAYTNTNYMLLAEIVEKVSGMQFKDFADSAIFKPLKMKHTKVLDFREPSKIGGYHSNGKRFVKRKLKSGTYGDDNIVTTLQDMALWNQNFYKNKLGRQNQSLIHKTTTNLELNDGKPSNRGYGWFIGKYRGRKIIYRDGENDLHTGFNIHFPE